MMAGRLSQTKRVAEKNLSAVPNQSGVYVLNRRSGSKYVGSAGAGRLQQRIRQQVNNKRGITSFRYRPTTSEAEARKLEGQYRDRLNPEQQRI